MKTAHLISLLAAVPAVAVAAAPAVTLDSKVFVEQVQLVDGRQQTVLKAPATILPGDKLIFQTGYRNAGTAPATKVVLTNPVPNGVTFSGDSSAGSEVSVDGGRTFGQLLSLKVVDVAGASRAARHTDVTTIRWVVASIAPGQTGSVKYRGIVR